MCGGGGGYSFGHQTLVDIKVACRIRRSRKQQAARKIILECKVLWHLEEVLTLDLVTRRYRIGYRTLPDAIGNMETTTCNRLHANDCMESTTQCNLLEMQSAVHSIER